MGTLLAHTMAQDISYPENVFCELGFSHAGEAYPHFPLVYGQQSTAPAKHRFALTHGSQINNFIDLQGLTVGNHNSAIYGSEVNPVPPQQTIMRQLNTDLNPPAAAVQANSITLPKAGHPNLGVQLENEVRV